MSLGFENGGEMKPSNRRYAQPNHAGKMGALLQKFLCGNERTNENSILE